MRPHPRLSPRLALAALGLILPARADAASMMSVVDLGAGVSGLVLGESGQVAGLGPTPGQPAYDPTWPNPGYQIPTGTGFEYNGGQFTKLDFGVVPIAVANDGQVIDARGPYAFTTIGGDTNHPFEVSPLAAAGNHLGELVGTASFQPFPIDQFGSNSDLSRTTVELPYIYIPNKPGLPYEAQAAANNPGGYLAGQDDSAQAGRGIPEAGTMYSPSPNQIVYTLSSGTHPTGVNDRGLVIGDIYSSDPQPSGNLTQPLLPRPSLAYIHAASDGVDIGTLGGLNSHAAAVNNSGLVVGNSDTASGANHAFLFTPTNISQPGIGKMIDLGVLPGMTASAALGVNDQGQVVGWSSKGSLSDAFLYSNGIMEDLNDRLPATMGIHLDQAVAINDAGQIVAYGHGADGVEHGYLLSATPTPEPTALALLLVAGVGLGVRRLRFSNVSRIEAPAPPTETVPGTN